jgi:hypothetical protein
MYKIKEIAEILNVSDKSVRRYLNSYFSINNGAYEVSEKMLEILKDEYLEIEADIVVQTYSAEEYDRLNVLVIEHPFLKERVDSLLKDMEYHRKSMESKERQMELLLRTIEQKNFLEAKEKGFN